MYNDVYLFVFLYHVNTFRRRWKGNTCGNCTVYGQTQFGCKAIQQARSIITCVASLPLSAIKCY